MKTFLKKDFRSILFIANLTLFGVTLAYMLLSELSEKEKLGMLLVLVVTVLNAIAVGISINKNNNSLIKENKNT